MICPACQSDNMSVTNSPERRDVEVEVRRWKCNECGAEYETETRITNLLLNGRKVPIENARGELEKIFEQFMNWRIEQHERAKKGKPLRRSRDLVNQNEVFDDG